MCMLSGNFFGTEIWHGIFWGFNFGPQFLGGFVRSPRDFFFFFLGGGGWFFAPTPSFLTPEIRSTPPPTPPHPGKD